MAVAQSAPATRPAPGLLKHTWSVPLLVFALTRVVDGVLIAVAASDQSARDEDVAMVDSPAGEGPGYLAALTNWDGQWYSRIAHDGYPGELPRVDGEVQQNVWAYYPLYPSLVRLVMALFHLPFAVAATTVSLVAGAAAMVLLYRLVERVGGRFNATTTVAAVCLFPAAPLFQAAYTESLALLLLVLCLTLLRDRRFGWRLVATTLLSFTRPIVLPVAAVIALRGIVRWRGRRDEPVDRRELAGYALTAAYAVVSFAFWPAVTGVVTGEADAYFQTQRAWILDESAGWPSWLAHALQPGQRVYAVLGLLALFAIVALVARRAARSWGPELRVWGPVYFLYVLGTTRPTSSVFRYALLTVVPAWPGVTEPGRTVSRRTRTAVLVTMVVVGIPLQYLWLRWFFIRTPGATATRRSSTGSIRLVADQKNLRVLVYSDDVNTRQQVILALGRRPHPTCPSWSTSRWPPSRSSSRTWTPAGIDLAILDGEAVPAGGMGIAKQLKDEIYQCPPLLVLTGRPQDAWLATWSRADAAVPHPIDPIQLAEAVTGLLRSRGRPPPR